MADNVTINAMGGGDTIAADDIAGVKVQRVKVGTGIDGAYADVSAGNPMPVGLASGASADAAVVAGTVGTSVQLPAAPGALGVTVKARSSNTGMVCVGGPSVTADDGFELAPGEAISADVTNPAALWIAVTDSGDGVCCLWVKA